MARTENDTVFKEVIEVILQNGLEGLPDALSIIINEAMRVERSRTLQAGPYERSETRIGYANGYKPKTLNSRVGQLFLSVPQVRGEGGGSVCQYHFGTRLKVVSQYAVLCSPLWISPIVPLFKPMTAFNKKCAKKI